MIRDLDLELVRDEYYIPKKAFDYPELSIMEIRLLVVLSTKKNIDISVMNYNTKMWICKDSRHYNKMKDMVNKLIEKGLLDENGRGLDFKKNKIKYIIYRDLSYFESKSIRQLFFKSICIWNSKYSEAIISTDTFYGLFGKSKMIINKNWKNVEKSTGLSYCWIEKNNKVYINKEKRDIGKNMNDNRLDKIKKPLSNFNTYKESVIPPPDCIPVFDDFMEDEASIDDLVALVSGFSNKDINGGIE